MKSLRPLFSGLLVLLLSSLVIFGSLTQALAEGSLARNPKPSQMIPSQVYAITLLPGRTATVPEAPPTLASRPAVTATFPHPTTCAVPPGWLAYTVRAGDTLSSLARVYQIDGDRLAEGNCLVTDRLVPGTILAVPANIPTAASTPTPSAVPCGPPRGWVTYQVQRGDTLYKLSRELGVTVTQLQFANCMGTSTLLRTNDRLSVPSLPARPTTRPVSTNAAPAVTNTPRDTETPLPPTQTQELSTPTDSPTLPVEPDTATPETPLPGDPTDEAEPVG